MPRRWRYFLALFASVVALLCLELGCLATRPTLGESVPGSLFATRCESRIIRYGARTSGRSPWGPRVASLPWALVRAAARRAPTFFPQRSTALVPGTRRVAWTAKRGFLTNGACGHLYLLFRSDAYIYRRSARTKRAANIVWIQLNMYAEVRTGLDWWICSLGVGAMTNPRRMNVKGTEKRVDDRVKAKRKRFFSLPLERVDEFRAPPTLLSRRRRFARLWSTTRIVRVSSWTCRANQRKTHHTAHFRT